MSHEHFVECYGFSAGEVGEAESQHTAAEAHSYWITQGQVLGIYGFAPVGYGSGITPASHPFVVFYCHSLCFDKTLIR